MNRLHGAWDLPKNVAIGLMSGCRCCPARALIGMIARSAAWSGGADSGMVRAEPCELPNTATSLALSYSHRRG
jgi:hypothetical protein